jgi:PIN domain nuclease of toxin-antitoxin system
VHQDDRLSSKAKAFIAQHETRHIGVSAISCWEVAKLVERGRLKLPIPTDQWLHAALAYPGVKLLELSPDIVADACYLPGGCSLRQGRRFRVPALPSFFPRKVPW